MSRESTDQLYIELGYYYPEEYYTYQAEAAAAIASSATVSCDAGLIKAAQASLTSQATLSAISGNVQQAQANLTSAVTQSVSANKTTDTSTTLTASASIQIYAAKNSELVLTAFTAGSLTASAQRQRDAELAATGAWTISVDYIRQRDTGYDETAAFTQSVAYLRSRDFASTVQAAFSLAADAEKLITTPATLTSSATITVNAIKSAIASSSLSSSATLSASASATIPAAASLSSKFTQSAFGSLRYEKPWQVKSVGSNLSIDTSVKKFGTGSLSSSSSTTGNLLTYYATDYYANSSASIDGMFVDFWLYKPVGGTIGNTILRFRDESTQTDVYRIQMVGTSIQLLKGANTSIIPLTTAGYTDGWNHIVWTYDDSNDEMTFFVNGSRKVSSIGNKFLTAVSGSKEFVIDLDTPSKIDELRVYVGNVTTYGYSPRLSTITVPTAPGSNYADEVQFIGHYNTNFNADRSALYTTSASLTSQFTQSAILSGPVRTSATLTSNFNLTATGQRLGELVLTAFTNATTTATATRTKSLEASLSSAATVFASPTVYWGFEADLNTAASITVNASRARDTSINLSSAVSVLATALRTKPLEAALSSAATVSATVNVDRKLASSMSSAATTTIAAAKTAVGTVDVLALFSPSITVFASRAGDVDLYASASLTVEGSRARDTEIDLASQAQLAVDYVRLKDLPAALAAAFTVDATPSGTISFESQQTSAFTVSNQVNLLKPFTAGLYGSFSQTTNTFDSLFITAEADLTANASISTTAGRIRSFTVGYAGDRTAKTVTAVGNAVISTAQSKFGSGSALITDTGDYFTVSGDADLYNGSFTAEMWVWATNLTQMPNGTIWDNRTSSSNGFYLYVSYGSIGLYEGITGKGLTSAGFNNSQWNHIAVVRNGTNIKVFVNGVQKISATVTSTNYSNRTTYIGSTYAGAVPFRAYIDEVRLSASARYTGAFTPATLAFTSDGATSALLHLDSDFSDDIGASPPPVGEFATLIVAAKAGVIIIDEITTTATLTVDAVVSGSAQIQLSTAAALTAVSSRALSSAIVDLQTSAAVTISGTTDQLAEADLNSAAIVTVAPNVVTDTDVNIAAEFLLSTSGAIKKSSASLVTAFGSLTATANRSRDTEITLQAFAFELTTGTKLNKASATLSAAFTVTAVGRDLRVDSIEYVIPREIWSYKIASETRLYSITEETRIHIVKGD